MSDTVHHSDRERRAFQSILDRARTDLVFRERLLNDPREAIFETFGMTFPTNFRIKFIERDPGVDALIVLPDVATTDGELSNTDPDIVSGGVREHAKWADDVDCGRGF